jgi:hypothetical protein
MQIGSRPNKAALTLDTGIASEKRTEDKVMAREVSRRRFIQSTAGGAISALLPRLSFGQSLTLEELHLINDDLFYNLKTRPTYVLCAQIMARPVLGEIVRSRSFDGYTAENLPEIKRSTNWDPREPEPLPSIPPTQDPATIPPINSGFVDQLAVAAMTASIGSLDMFSDAIDREKAAQRIATLANSREAMVESDSAHRIMARRCGLPNGTTLGHFIAQDARSWGERLGRFLMKPETIDMFVEMFIAEPVIAGRLIRFSLYKTDVLNPDFGKTVRFRWVTEPVLSLVAGGVGYKAYPPNWYDLAIPKQASHVLTRNLRRVTNEAAGESEDWSRGKTHTNVRGMQIACTEKGRRHGKQLAAFLCGVAAQHGLTTGAPPRNVVPESICRGPGEAGEPLRFAYPGCS